MQPMEIENSEEIENSVTTRPFARWTLGGGGVLLLCAFVFVFMSGDASSAAAPPLIDTDIVGDQSGTSDEANLPPLCGQNASRLHVFDSTDGDYHNLSFITADFDRQLMLGRRQGLRDAFRRAFSGGAPLHVSVLGGSFTVGRTCHREASCKAPLCNAGDANGRCHIAASPICSECAWPARVQRTLDTQDDLRGKIHVANLGLAATCSVCVLGALDAMLSGQVPDLVLVDYSLNDHEDVYFKKGKTSGVEALVRRLLCMKNAPSIWMLQTKPEPEPTSYRLISEWYSLPYLDLQTYLPASEFEKMAWPHPFWSAQSAVADIVLQSLARAAQLDMCDTAQQAPSTFPCNYKALSSDELLSRFANCEVPLTAMTGPDRRGWGKVHAGSCWSFSHHDVPSRPDKRGWLFDSKSESCQKSKGGDVIRFELNVTRSAQVTIGRVMSYEGFVDASCSLELPQDGSTVPREVKLRSRGTRGSHLAPNGALRGIYPHGASMSRVTLTESTIFFANFTGILGTQQLTVNLTCRALKPTHVTHPSRHKFKIMLLSSC